MSKPISLGFAERKVYLRDVLATIIALLDLSPEPPGGFGIGVAELLAIGGICCATLVPVIVVVAAVLVSKRKQKSDG